MKLLANFAKRRLEILDYRDDNEEVATILQSFYADELKRKNVVNNEEKKEYKKYIKYIDPRKITTSWRMSGKLIWEVTMSVDIKGTRLKLATVNYYWTIALLLGLEPK